MVAKWLALALTAAFGALLQAQTSAAISGAATETHEHAFLIEVDHGSTPTAIDVTVDVTTASAAGLWVDMGDFDMFLERLPGAEVSDWVVGAGTVVLQLALPARAGVHQIYVSFEPEDPVMDSPFAGTVTVSTGTVAIVDSAQYALEFSGTRVRLGRIIEHWRETAASGVFWMDFTVDFGATPQAGWMATGIGGVPATSIRLLDMSSTPPTELVAITSSIPDGLLDETWHDIGTLAGVIRFRAEFTKAAGDGIVASVVVLPGHATLLSATDSLAPRPSGGGGGDDDGCVAGPAGSLGLAALLPALAFARRRRRT